MEVGRPIGSHGNPTDGKFAHSSGIAPQAYTETPQAPWPCSLTTLPQGPNASNQWLLDTYAGWYSPSPGKRAPQGPWGTPLQGKRA